MAGPIRSPLFTLCRAVAGTVAGTASGLVRGGATANTALATGAPSIGPAMDRRAALAQMAGMALSTALVPPLLFGGGCASLGDRYIVLERGPDILEMKSSNGDGPISDEFRAAALAAFHQLPVPIRILLRTNYYLIYLASTVQEHEHLADAMAAGTHSPRHIIVGEYVRVGTIRRFHSNVGRIVRHEVGHAIDWHFRVDPSREDYLSASAPFRAALAHDLRRHTARQQDALRALLADHGYSGFSRGGDPYADNAYANAEIFAILFAELVHGNTTDPLYQYLPRVTEFVRFHGLLRPALEAGLPPDAMARDIG